MRLVRRRLALVALPAIVLIAGCAVPPRAAVQNDVKNDHWQGRLSLRLEADDPSASARFFSAAFDLKGDVRQGELLLLTPLGTRLATIGWDDQQAWLRTGAERRQFASLAHLTQEVLGAELPLAAVLGWLSGHALLQPGWQADLSQQPQGRILARRMDPLPAVELRLLLDP